jgi:hypothetical protein
MRARPGASTDDRGWLERLAGLTFLLIAARQGYGWLVRCCCAVTQPLMSTAFCSKAQAVLWVEVAEQAVHFGLVVALAPHCNARPCGRLRLQARRVAGCG